MISFKTQFKAEYVLLGASRSNVIKGIRTMIEIPIASIVK